MRVRGALVVSLFLAGCGAEAPVPDQPTWVDDVKPIFQGNCFGCHGTGAVPDEERFRWDVYKFDVDPKYAELGFPATSFKSPTDPVHAILYRGYLTSPTEIGRMPPPPATRLSDRDVAVVLKWIDSGFPQGEHHPNHKPRIAWVAKPLFEVVDDDHDQVMGKLDCVGKSVPIPSTGGFQLPDGAMLPCTARLYDGFEEAGGQLQ
jgi:mono/diheme cytochrome c family protein